MQLQRIYDTTSPGTRRAQQSSSSTLLPTASPNQRWWLDWVGGGQSKWVRGGSTTTPSGSREWGDRADEVQRRAAVGQDREIGILASVFTAVFNGRWFFDLLLSRRDRVERLSI